MNLSNACDVSPFVITEDKNGFHATVNPEYAQKLREHRYRKAGIPIKYWDISFEDYIGNESCEEKEKIQKYSERILDKKLDCVNLYLWSVVPSCQKTSLACNVLKKATEFGCICSFVLASELIRNLLQVQGYNRDETSNDFLYKLYHSDILCISDIFNPKTSLHWEKSSNTVCAWDEFLKKSVASGQKIILTSTTPPYGIKDKYGVNLENQIKSDFVHIELKDEIKDKSSEGVKKKFEEAISA